MGIDICLWLLLILIANSWEMEEQIALQFIHEITLFLVIFFIACSLLFFFFCSAYMYIFERVFEMRFRCRWAFMYLHENISNPDLQTFGLILHLVIKKIGFFFIEHFSFYFTSTLSLFLPPLLSPSSSLYLSVRHEKHLPKQEHKLSSSPQSHRHFPTCFFRFLGSFMQILKGEKIPFIKKNYHLCIGYVVVLCY